MRHFAMTIWTFATAATWQDVTIALTPQYINAKVQTAKRLAARSVQNLLMFKCAGNAVNPTALIVVLRSTAAILLTTSHLLSALAV